MRTITDQPYSKLFWRIVPLFCLCCALVPFFCYPVFRGDTIEQLIISREWCVGTFKHPTLPAWILGLFENLTFRWSGTPYLTAALCTMAVLISIWRLSREYLDSKRACFATLTLTCYWYCNLGCTIIYNQNVPLGMFWVLSITTFHFALVRNKPLNWILFGACLAGGMSCKYTLIYVALSALFFLIISPHRTKFLTIGPWLAILTSFLLFLPHLLFFFKYHTQLQNYAIGDPLKTKEFCFAMISGWGTQFGIIAPVCLSLVPLICFSRSPKEGERFSPNEKKEGASPLFPLIMFILPILIMIISQIIFHVAFRLKSYGFPLWFLLPFCVLYYFPIRTDPKAWQWGITLCAIFAVGELSSMIVQSSHSYWFKGKQSAKFFPAKSMCDQVDALWAAKWGDKPCPFVCGNWESHLYYAWFSKYQPRKDGTGYSAWNTREDVMREGGVILWIPQHNEQTIPEEWKQLYPTAYFVGFAESPYLQKNKAVPPARWGIAFIPPAE